MFKSSQVSLYSKGAVGKEDEAGSAFEENYPEFLNCL